MVAPWGEVEFPPLWSQCLLRIFFICFDNIIFDNDINYINFKTTRVISTNCANIKCHVCAFRQTSNPKRKWSVHISCEPISGVFRPPSPTSLDDGVPHQQEIREQPIKRLHKLILNSDPVFKSQAGICVGLDFFFCISCF